MKPQDLLNALDKAVENMDADNHLLSNTHSAGFVYADEAKTTGYQIFVKVARWEKGLLTFEPMTGGLVENDAAKFVA